MNGRTTLAVIVFGIAAVFSFMLKGGDSGKTTGDESDLSAGYYLTGVALTGTDALGEIKFRLTAERVDHNPADGTIAMTNLALDYGTDKSPWMMHARSGWMPMSNDEINLSGAVEVQNDDINKNGSTTIRSETLHVDISTQSASTGDPVTITVGRGSLQGVGLEVDFANERFNILSEVSGVFDPATP